MAIIRADALSLIGEIRKLYTDYVGYINYEPINNIDLDCNKLYILSHVSDIVWEGEQERVLFVVENVVRCTCTVDWLRNTLRYLENQIGEARHER